MQSNVTELTIALWAYSTDVVTVSLTDAVVIRVSLEIRVSHCSVTVSLAMVIWSHLYGESSEEAPCA